MRIAFLLGICLPTTNGFELKEKSRWVDVLVLQGTFYYAIIPDEKRRMAGQRNVNGI